MAKIYRDPAHMTDNELQPFDAEYTDINDEKELTAPQKSHWEAVKTEIQSRAPSDSSGDSGEVTHEPAPEPAPTAPEPKQKRPQPKAATAPKGDESPSKKLTPYEATHAVISSNSGELLAQLPARTMEERGLYRQYRPHHYFQSQIKGNDDERTRMGVAETGDYVRRRRRPAHRRTRILHPLRQRRPIHHRIPRHNGNCPPGSAYGNPFAARGL